MDAPFSLGAWREELKSCGRIMMCLTYQAKRLYFNPVAKLTSSWGNLHFRNVVEHLIVLQWAKIVMVLLKPNYNEAEAKSMYEKVSEFQPMQYLTQQHSNKTRNADIFMTLLEYSLFF